MNTNKKIYDIIKEKYNNIISPLELKDIPNSIYMVYIFVWNNIALVVGMGKKNRARVILDPYIAHYKATLIRLYLKYEQNGIFERYVIPCSTKKEALIIEKDLHNTIGGEGIILTDKIKKNITSDDNIQNMISNMALCSSYDATTDLLKWRKNKLIEDDIWNNIKNILDIKEK